MINSNHKICVLGGGSWGATLASHLAKKGIPVHLWEFMDSQVEEMKKTRTLSFLKQLHIPESIFISSNMKEALEGTSITFSVVPSQFVRSTWKKAKTFIQELELVATFSKGIETDSLKRMSEVIIEECPQASEKIAAVSGPSHAEEVALGIPTAIVAASKNKAIAESAQNLLTTSNLRIYTNPDVVGIELCGALKNIFAIACGACDGLHLGDNTKSALITRGLNEMSKLGEKMGAKETTFFGLAGMGDLVVTCLSQHSRNRLLGEKIGMGKSVKEALKEMTMVAEGFPTAKSAYQLVKKYNSDCPILMEIYHVLYEGKNIKDSMRDLLARPAHGEIENMKWNL